MIFLVKIKNEPGTELFFREATLQVSSPRSRFTLEFGMESKWFHDATSTRKNCWGQPLPLTCSSPQDCINLELFNRQSPSIINFQFYFNLRSSPRSVSTPRLQTLLLFHLTPINGCSSRDLTGLLQQSTHLEVGFPLRCFQRLSAPHLATQRLPLAR